MSGILLITHILGLKRAPSGGAVNIEKDLALVAKSIEMLESLQYECVRLATAVRLNTEYPSIA